MKTEKELRMRLQKAFCKKYKQPMFAPSDGICHWCHKRIEDKGGQLITGCNNCNHTFVD